MSESTDVFVITPNRQIVFFPETENLNFGHRCPSCPYKPLSISIQTLRYLQFLSHFQLPKFKFSVSRKKNVRLFRVTTKTSVSKYLVTKMYLYHILVIWTLCTCFKRVLLPASWAPRIKMSISSGSFLSSCRICLSIFLLIALASSTLPKTRLYKCEKIQPMMLFLTASTRGPKNTYVFDLVVLTTSSKMVLYYVVLLKLLQNKFYIVLFNDTFHNSIKPRKT